jgi:UDP-N-acetylmuramate: L-alanyl-gamma-D-glutamyl-meso-diaminopimelate ligase
MKVHFISIGGSVMHQLALALQQKGYVVTGSDDEIFEPSRTVLQQAGLLPQRLGWYAENITPDLDAVLLGMHARADNPELLKAQSLQLPVFSFPEYIYSESRQKLRVVIGGSHGKTTTTGMVMHVLKHQGKAFDYLVGARLPGFDQSVAITNAPVMVCEGDEYPASALEKRPKFHFLHPHIAVITGIAWDHINVFPTYAQYVEQFNIFINKLEPGASLIYCSHDADLVNLVENHPRTDIARVPYGIAPHRVAEGTTILKLEGHEAELQIFGNHNLMNIQAAWLVCSQLGVSAAGFSAAIASFTGASRRLEVLARRGKRTVYRDFAHAPSKVKATLDAVRSQFAASRLVAVLELHTYSSLNAAFMPHYRHALKGANAACVFYSPHAMEIKKMPPLPVEAVQQGFAHENLTICTSRAELEAFLAAEMPDGENLLLMSSGSYDGLDTAALAANWVTTQA